MSEIRQVIAQRFRAARAAAGMTLQEVTSAMGMSSPSRFSQWELGERTPKYEQVLEAARVLNRPPAWLAGLTQDEGLTADARYLAPNTYAAGVSPQQLVGSVAYSAEYLKARNLRDEDLICVRALDDVAPDIRRGDELLIHRAPGIDPATDLYAIHVGQSVLICRITLDVTGDYEVDKGKGNMTQMTAAQVEQLEIIGPVVRISRDI